ncbi:hypothetical protein RHMOL_Rhmol01G0114100 [Rhododendron molle]|uniref:Uncharacterized protein n=1 Tax=Rhododendron molle TaxID=49168 RepID=A0ACC0Q3A4_RHOML|nr:hypothetical protein RHMOL_Rhmol01G0114100 [Rhododendron molle]
MQESKRAAPTPRPRQNPLMVPSKVHMRISWSRSRDLQKPVVRRCSLPFAVVRPFSSVSQHPKSKPSLHIQSLSCFIKLKLETESIGLSEFVIFVLSWSGMNCDACSRTNPDFSGGAGNVKRHWRQGYANYCLRLSSTDKAVDSSVVHKLEWDVLLRMGEFGPFIFVVPLLLRLATPFFVRPDVKEAFKTYAEGGAQMTASLATTRGGHRRRAHTSANPLKTTPHRHVHQVHSHDFHEFLFSVNLNPPVGSQV